MKNSKLISKIMWKIIIYSVIIISYFFADLTFSKDKIAESNIKIDAQQTDTSLVLTATLKDEKGNPIQESAVYFSSTSLYGIWKIGAAVTNSDGIAKLSLNTTIKGRAKFTALYRGTDKYSPATDSLEISIGGLQNKQPDVMNLKPPSLFLSWPELLFSSKEDISNKYGFPEPSFSTPNPPKIMIIIIITVFGFVWLVYGYIFYQFIRIRKP